MLSKHNEHKQLSELTKIGLCLWYLMPLQQYFSYIMAVSFIGGGNQST
jgi:hypothetical protein